MKYTVPINATNGNEHYVDANPTLGIEGSIVSAAAIEPAMREVVNTITAAGLTPSADDMTQLTQAVKRLSANAAGENSIPTYYAGEFKDFFEQTPPVGWAVRDGHVLSNADVNFPALWLELQKPENAWKLKTEAEWQAMAARAAAASPYKVGGVPYFVLDTDAKTIKLPDTRTDFLRNANGNVGTWQEDAVGSFNTTNSFASSSLDPTGGFNPVGADSQGQVINTGLHINTVNPETRPRNIALLGCVCIEPAKAQRNEATTTTPGAVYLASGADDQRANAVPSVAMAAGLGMPSDRYRDLTLGASGTSYVAPADGYFSISKSSDTDATAEYVQLANANMSTRCIAPQGVAYSMSVVLPCRSGDSVVVSYLSTGATTFFRFIYAQGAY